MTLNVLIGLDPVLTALLSAVAARFDLNSAALARIEAAIAQGGAQQMATIADLQAKVRAQSDVVQSVVTLIQGLRAQLDAAKTDPAALDQIIADLDAQDTALGQAVVANTPAAG